jgi:4-amino-4-deoxy-L-arabinose transferase-like glycosyltransferase
MDSTSRQANQPTARMKKLFSYIKNHPLAAILFISVALRIAIALYFGNRVTADLPGTNDQISYHNLTLRVLGGHGFSFGENWWPNTRAGEPTSHWSFLYTLYLVLVYKLFGANPLVARVIQAVAVGLLQPYLAYRLGTVVFNRVVGLLTAGFTAVYVYFIYYAGTLMTEPFYITAILGVLYLSVLLSKAFQEANGRRLKYALTIGVLLGITVLLRQLFLLLVPFLFLWLWLLGGKLQILPRLKYLVISGLILIGMILPFTAFNYARFHRFVLLNTNSGYAFYFGNHPVYGTHFIPILDPAKNGVGYDDLVPTELRTLDEAALDNELLSRGIRFVIDDPRRYILLSLSRIPVYFSFLPSKDSGLLSNLSRVLSFGLFLPFMIYGLILSLWDRSSQSTRKIASPAFLLLMFITIYSIIHLLSWTLIRYRLPVDAVLLIFAGLAFTDLYKRLFHQNMALA